MRAEDNQKITKTGPGTPGGDLLRGYWQPVALADELRDEPPVPVRLLGEDFVLFRDERRPLRPARPRLPASRRRPRLRPARGRRPALPVPWLAVRRRGQVPGDTGRAGGQRLCQRRSASALSGGGEERHRLRLPRRGRRAGLPRLRLLPRARHARLRLQGPDRLQLAAGARGRHRPGARLLPAPLLRGRGPVGAAYGKQFRADLRRLRHPDDRRCCASTTGPTSTSRRPTTACACSPCASSTTKHTHVRVTNLVFPYAFVDPDERGDDDHPVARADRRHVLLLVRDLHQFAEPVDQ